MQSISEFFKKIQGVRAREYLARKAVADAIKTHTPLDVPIEAISIKSSIAVIKGISQAARSAIFIKKAAIMKDANASQGLRRISDIK